MDFEPCLVQTTINDLRTAQVLAKKLLANRLAACVQLDQVASIYNWQDEVVEDQEIRLNIKTVRAFFPTLEQEIKKHHPYKCPEIIALPVVEISKDYRQWLEDFLPKSFDFK